MQYAAAYSQVIIWLQLQARRKDCQSCVAFWGKKCPFCGLEVVLLPRDTKKSRIGTKRSCV